MLKLQLIVGINLLYESHRETLLFLEYRIPHFWFCKLLHGELTCWEVSGTLSTQACGRIWLWRELLKLRMVSMMIAPWNSGHPPSSIQTELIRNTQDMSSCYVQ